MSMGDTRDAIDIDRCIACLESRYSSYGADDETEILDRIELLIISSPKKLDDEDETVDHPQCDGEVDDEGMELHVYS